MLLLLLPFVVLVPSEARGWRAPRLLRSADDGGSGGGGVKPDSPSGVGLLRLRCCGCCCGLVVGEATRSDEALPPSTDASGAVVDSSATSALQLLLPALVLLPLLVLLLAIEKAREEAKEGRRAARWRGIAALNVAFWFVLRQRRIIAAAAAAAILLYYYLFV